MSTNLVVHIESKNKLRHGDIDFYEADEWTLESQQQLLTRIKDVISIARTYSRSLEVTINIGSDNLDAALFYINRKKNHDYFVRSQKLSTREIEILGLIMQGLTTKEIAKKLFINFETVRSHRKNILRKTGAKNTATLVNYYHQTFFEK